MDLVRALGDLAEAPGPEQVRTARLLELPGEPARNEYTDLFVVQLYPYASVYLSPDGQLGGQVQDHIASFWRVLRQPVPRDPDHIATLFATYAQLVARAKQPSEAYLDDLTQQMRHAFLWGHIASWMLPYATRVRELGSAVYRAWGGLLVDALEAEARTVGELMILPLPLRNSMPLDAEVGIETLVDGLFAPARSGFILARADLSRCARDLGLKTRIADRRYTLRSLIEQDQKAVCTWLSGEAVRQADLMNGMPAVFDQIARHWRGRASATATLLLSLATTPLRMDARQ